MKRRGLLILLALSGLVTASIAVAVAAYIQRLPEPEQADQHGLFRWLVQTHLRDEPQEIQMRLLNRVEEELSSGIDLTQCLTQIDATQSARLLENVDRLAECWFFREADRYEAEPVAGRMALLRRQAARVRQLGILEQISALESHAGDPVVAKTPAGNPADAKISADENSRRLDRWLLDTAPQQREKMAQYFSDLRMPRFGIGSSNGSRRKNPRPESRDRKSHRKNRHRSRRL